MARKLIATPETIWLPRWVMQAKPCSSASMMETQMPAPSPSQAEPVTAAAAPAAKAAPSILPSRPMSKTPERSEYRPARAASSSGVDSRTVLSRMRIIVSNMGASPQAVREAGADNTPNSLMRPGRNMCSNAPAKRITSAWITTIMSRVMAGISKASSAPP